MTRPSGPARTSKAIVIVLALLGILALAGGTSLALLSPEADSAADASGLFSVLPDSTPRGSVETKPGTVDERAALARASANKSTQAPSPAAVQAAAIRPSERDLRASALRFDTDILVRVSMLKRASIRRASAGLGLRPAAIEGPQMPDDRDEGDCVACHKGYPTPLHPMSNCAGCHGTDSPVGDFGLPLPDSDDPVHVADLLEFTDCGDCHGAGYASVPPFHGPPAPESHLTTTDMTACVDCHSGDLLVEHYRYTDDSGQKYTCATCHASDEPLVQGAIASGSTNCGACHPGYEDGHGEAHISDIDQDSISGTVAGDVPYGPITCTECHEQDAVAEHLKDSSSSAPAGCNNCHPSPRDTLDPWEKGCVQGGCHPAGTPTEQHGATTAAHETLPANDDCTACHSAGDLADIHATATDDGRTSCLVCHSQAVPATKDCDTCHPDKTEPHGHESDVGPLTTSGDYTGGGAWGPYRCDDCHLTELTSEHARTGSSAAPESCGACHPTPVNTLTPDWERGCVQGGCHPAGTPQEQHGQISAAHAFDSQTAKCTGSGCHDDNDVSEIHADTDSECLTCHSTTGQATKTCEASGCHPDKVDGEGNVVDHGYDAAAHLSSIDTSAASGSYPNGDWGPTPCLACHLDNELYPLHQQSGSSAAPDGCGACHPTPVDTLSPEWEKGCVQNGCHPAGTPQEQHGDMDSAHEPLAANASCTTSRCHDQGDVAAVHVGGDQVQPCLLCHDPSATTKNCETCHPVYTTPHGYSEASHVSDTSGQSLSGTVAGDVPYGPYDCTECHLALIASRNAPTTGEHGKTSSSSAAAACAACHPQPFDSTAPAWSEGCVQGGCHAVGSGSEQHGGVAAAHETLPANSECVSCHDVGDLADIHATAEDDTRSSCLVCHSTTVPTTRDCVACHPSAVEPHGHLSSVATDTISGDYPTASWGPITCESCHQMQIPTEHDRSSASSSEGDGCTQSTCHPSPRDSFTDWNETCTQGGCHTSGVYHPPGAMASQHDSDVVANEACTPAGCHDQGDVGAIHAPDFRECLNCHSATTMPDTVVCTDCHEPHADIGVVHIADEPGSITWPATGVSAPCTQCHYLDIRDEHAKPTSGALDCEDCHAEGGPVDQLPGGDWDKKCASCHDSIHPDYDAEHYLPDSDCSECHSATGGPIDGRDHPSCSVAAPAQNTTGSCHTGPDFVPSIRISDPESGTDGYLWCRRCHPDE